MNRLKFSVTALLLLSLLQLKGQVIERVDPPSWFTGMHDGALQLMVYGEGIGDWEVQTDYPGVEVKTLVRTDNPNYLFVNLYISSEALAGTVRLTFINGRKSLTHDYPLSERPSGPARGFNSSDVIYLSLIHISEPTRPY